MKKLVLFFFFLTVNAFAFSQTVVVKNPAWEIDDQVKARKEDADRLREYVKLQEQVQASRERLKMLKEATTKLREVNRKVANYRYLEMAVEDVADSYARVLRTLKTLNDDNCFSPAEYRRINESLMSLVNQTSFAVNALTVVVTDNFSSMTDGERLMNLQTSLRMLRDDLGTVNNAIFEVELLNEQRKQIRTLKYFKAMLNSKNRN